MTYTYNIIWDNDNNTKIRTNKLLTDTEIKTAFESLSKRKVKEIQRIEVLNSYTVNEAEKVNLIFTYTYYEGENSFCYYRNFIPDYKNTFNSNEFVQAFKDFKNTIWGETAVINNASTTK